MSGHRTALKVFAMLTIDAFSTVDRAEMQTEFVCAERKVNRENSCYN